MRLFPLLLLAEDFGEPFGVFVEVVFVLLLRRAQGLEADVPGKDAFADAHAGDEDCQVAREGEDALAVLGPVLAEHERRGTPGFVLWEGGIMVPLLRLAIERGVHAAFAARVLDLFGATDEARQVPETGETLTAREVEVLRLVADGLTDGQVAKRLYVSPRTVGNHLHSVYQKLCVPSRAAAVRKALERRLI